MIVGRVSDVRDDGSSATQMAYGVLDLGREKIVARYVGPIEQMAFNESVLRQSLASIEGERSPLTDTVAVDGREMGHGSRGVRLGPGADALGMGRRARRSVDLLRPAAADRDVIDVSCR
jgi:hypothetical protein